MPLYCWGSNSGGHFGDEAGVDYYYPEKINTTVEFDSMVTGGEYAFGLTATGEVYGCGKSTHGQLGKSGDNKAFERLSIRNVKQIAAGYRHSMALAFSGSVFVCGDNTKGQLGLGATIKERFEWTLLPLDEPITYICCGVFFSVAIGSSGHLFVWGMNKRTMLCDQGQSILWIPVKTLFAEPIVKVSAGHHHLLALSKPGTLYCSGNVSSKSTWQDVEDIYSGWKTVIIRFKGSPDSLHLYGSNDLGQLCSTDPCIKANIITVKGIRDVAIGGEHGLILTNDSLLAWGWNEHGCLGQGHNKRIELGHPIKINFPPENIGRVFAGYGACYMRTKTQG